jgi:hypothetical protein
MDVIIAQVIEYTDEYTVYVLSSASYTTNQLAAKRLHAIQRNIALARQRVKTRMSKCLPGIISGKKPISKAWSVWPPYAYCSNSCVPTHTVAYYDVNRSGPLSAIMVSRTEWWRHYQCSHTWFGYSYLCARYASHFIDAPQLPNTIRALAAAHRPQTRDVQKITVLVYNIGKYRETFVVSLYEVLVDTAVVRGLYV